MKNCGRPEALKVKLRFAKEAAKMGWFRIKGLGFAVWVSGKIQEQGLALTGPGATITPSESH